MCRVSYDIGMQNNGMHYCIGHGHTCHVTSGERIAHLTNLCHKSILLCHNELSKPPSYCSHCGERQNNLFSTHPIMVRSSNTPRPWSDISWASCCWRLSWTQSETCPSDCGSRRTRRGNLCSRFSFPGMDAIKIKTKEFQSYKPLWNRLGLCLLVIIKKKPVKCGSDPRSIMFEYTYYWRKTVVLTLIFKKIGCL